MVFSSMIFLWIFLPTVLICYFLSPQRFRNGLLVFFSLLFYAWGEPVYIFLMLLCVGVNYTGGQMLEKYPRQKKKVLCITVVVNLLLLCYFKYFGLLADLLNGIITAAGGSGFSFTQAALPVGISFYTFQALSYVIDVYWEHVEVQKNYFNILLYISFFPQLIAGPIVKYRDINEAIENRVMNADEIAKGLRRFICGLGKKVLIANTAGLVADHVFTAAHSKVNFVVAWIGAIAYLMQIYYDFSGYSDMAIGLGHMFGFHFKENFQYPYGADSIQEFWRRWHISLSTWFKEYLYIPLGGNRKGTARTCINRIIVFFFTGLWHGANWTFVIWGLWHGMFLLFETYCPIVKKAPKVIARIYTLLVVCVGFVMFRADTLTEGLFMIKQMFTGFSMDPASMSFAVQQLTPWFVVMLAAGIIGAAPIRKLVDHIRENVQPEVLTGKWKTVQIVLYVASAVLLIWCMIRLSGSTYNPFIYFRF